VARYKRREEKQFSRVLSRKENNLAENGKEATGKIRGRGKERGETMSWGGMNGGGWGTETEGRVLHTVTHAEWMLHGAVLLCLHPWTKSQAVWRSLAVSY
jgi:hypothetical protein